MTSRRASAAGFTLVELMIYLAIALSVIGSIYKLVVSQSRSYTVQREMMDVRSTLRGAAVLLTTELQGVAAADSDLYVIGANGFTMRSVQGTAVICSEHPTADTLKYGLRLTGGDITATADDSALVLATGASNATTDDKWKRLRIFSVMPQSGSGVPDCFWGGTKGKGKGKGSVAGVAGTTGAQVPDLVVNFTGNGSAAVDDIYMGAPLLAFRKVEYGLYQDQGRWWLGRKVGGSATWQKLTGPMRAPADSGLALIYRDASNNVTANRLLVADVEIVLKGESFGKAQPVEGGSLASRQESYRTRVALRN